MRQLPVLSCQSPVAGDFVLCCNPDPARAQHPQEPFMTVRLDCDMICTLALHHRYLSLEPLRSGLSFDVETAAFHHLRSYLARKYPSLPLSRIHDKTIIVLACERYPGQGADCAAPREVPA